MKSKYWGYLAILPIFTAALFDWKLAFVAAVSNIVGYMESREYYGKELFARPSAPGDR